jgi:hypothetical protein
MNKPHRLYRRNTRFTSLAGRHVPYCIAQANVYICQAARIYLLDGDVVTRFGRFDKEA